MTFAERPRREMLWIRHICAWARQSTNHRFSFTDPISSFFHSPIFIWRMAYIMGIMGFLSMQAVMVIDGSSRVYLPIACGRFPGLNTTIPCLFHGWTPLLFKWMACRFIYRLLLAWCRYSETDIDLIFFPTVGYARAPCFFSCASFAED